MRTIGGRCQPSLYTRQKGNTSDQCESHHYRIVVNGGGGFKESVQAFLFTRNLVLTVPYFWTSFHQIIVLKVP